MRNKLLLIGICLTAILQSCYGQQEKVDSNQQKFAVLELFTSEGCSSCPPADKLLPILKSIYKGHLYTLAFHVDYWNRLGWKDAYSSHQFSARQNQYAAAFHAHIIYTPQAIINGTAQITGSDKSGLEKIIDDELQNGTKTIILLSAKSTAADNCNISYKSDLKDNEVLHIALLQLHAVTNVKNGENGGRTLEHQDIVRVFETFQNNNGQINFKIPEGLNYKQCHVIAYTQQKSDMKITGVTEVAIE